MKSRLHPNSIQSRIVLIAMAFILLIGVVSSAVTYTISRRYLALSSRQSANNTLQLVAGEVDRDLSSIITFANWIQINSSISSYLQQAGREDYSQKSSYSRTAALTAWNRFNDELNASSARSYIGRAVVATSSGSTYIQLIPRQDSPSGVDVAHAIMDAPFFEPLYSAQGYEWVGITPNPVRPGGSLQVIPILRPVESESSSRVLGWMYLEISPELVTNRMRQITLPEDSALFLTLGGHTYAYADSRLTEVSSLPADVMTVSLAQKGWSISVIPSSSEVRSQQHYYVGVVLLIFLGIVLAGSVMTLLLRRMIARPVLALLSKLEKVGQGDFSKDPSIEWNNELGSIGRGINALSSNVQELMDKRLQDEKEQQELEYQILQSQINPHFMYNTLNTIKWMAAIQGADGIADISTALSRLLKNISKSKENIIPLRAEIALVNDYFTIMKYRYGGTISLEYQIDDESLLCCRVNRFSLQPIVENAIFHGIEPKGSAGTITIHVYRGEHNTLQIAVTDNGVGMDEEMIQKVLSGESEGTNDFFRHIGVSNVNQRIKFAFGQQYGITITSRVGEYTTMLFTLPLQMEQPQTSERPEQTDEPAGTGSSGPDLESKDEPGRTVPSGS